MSPNKWYSDICAKRHLRERHLREVRGKGTKLGEGERNVRLSQDRMPILGEGERD
jgi:hypothetical protein